MKSNWFLKRTLLVLAIGALVAMMVVPAFATEILYLENSILNDTKNLTIGDRGWGFEFVGNGQYLRRVILTAHNTSAAFSVLCRAYLYNASGNLPNPTVPVDYTEQVTVNPNGTGAQFTFDFGSDVILSNGENYFFGVVANGTATGTGAWEAGEGSDTAVLMNEDGWGDSWTYYGATLCYKLYTDDELGGGTSYTPPYTYDPTSWDSTISALTSFIIPLVIILLPVLLLVTITRSTDKWIILIGITIGVGLGFFFNLVPIWLVFLVVIGLVGMAYQSVRGGNS